MQAIRQHLSATRVLLVLVASLAVASAAWATTGSSGSKIHACAAKRGGALRVAAHCRHTERALTWSTSGAPGAPGADGAPGAAGAIGTNGSDGARGPSDVYAAGTAFKAGLGALPASFGKLILPAGSYLIEASAVFFAKGEESDMECLIAPETPPSDFFATANTSSKSEFFPSSLSLSTVQTFTSTQDVELDCGVLVGKGDLENAHLWAIRTESVHGSLPQAES
jgi:hypothetical protein